MRYRNLCRSSHSGFGLVEAIVAAAVFSFAVIASLTALKVALSDLDQALIITDGQIKAQSAMEEAVSVPDRSVVFSGIEISKGSGGDTALQQKLKKRLFETGRKGNARIGFEQDSNAPQDFAGLSIILETSAGDAEAYKRYFHEH